MEKVSLDMSRKDISTEEELWQTVISFPVLYDKSRKEKDAVTIHGMVLATALEFISLFGTILFIWLNLLVLSVPNLYPLKKPFSEFGGYKRKTLGTNGLKKHFLFLLQEGMEDEILTGVGS